MRGSDDDDRIDASQFRKIMLLQSVSGLFLADQVVACQLPKVGRDSEGKYRLMQHASTSNPIGGWSCSARPELPGAFSNNQRL